jgi:hypothetical protein
MSTNPPGSQDLGVPGPEREHLVEKRFQRRVEPRSGKTNPSSSPRSFERLEKNSRRERCGTDWKFLVEAADYSTGSSEFYRKKFGWDFETDSPKP